MTLCEIYIREVGTVHPYLIQCVLRINIFNEVIFILVWHWLLFVIVLTACDLAWRIFNQILLCSTCQRKLFALKYLELIHLNSLNRPETNTANLNANELSKLADDSYLFVIESDKAKRAERKQMKNIEREQEFNLFEKFCELNFNNDTVFALRLIERNASSSIVSEIVEHLWLKFKYLNLVHSTQENDFMMRRLLVLKKNNNVAAAQVLKQKQRAFDEEEEKFLLTRQQIIQDQRATNLTGLSHNTSNTSIRSNLSRRQPAVGDAGGSGKRVQINESDNQHN
jgi:hypothetical protein